jgi:glycosyltransferase involved in cell wall biosynthesis
MRHDTSRMIYHHRTRGGGVEGVHIRGIAEALRRRKWDVTIVSPPGVALESGAQSVKTPIKKPVKKSRLWSVVADRLPEWAFEALELLYNCYSLYSLGRAVKQTSADAIYERYALFNFAGTWIARWKRIPIILEVNDATVIVRSRPLAARWLAARIEKRVFENATHLVTVSENFKDLIVRIHGIAPERIRVLPNAVHPKQVIAPQHAAAPTERFTLGMVAAFLPWHGLELVIKGTADFLKETGSKLLLVGDGPERTRINQWISELDLGSHVECVGAVPAAKVAQYVDQMDVCVLGHAADHASPMKLFEYMSRGKAVLAPAVGPIREVTNHKLNAWLFTPGDVESLMDGVFTLHRDAKLRAGLGRAARQKVLAEHTWDHRVAEIESWLGHSLDIPAVSRQLDRVEA